MALVQCHECGNEISAQAACCPKCGAKQKPQTSRTAKLIVVAGGILLFAAIISANQPDDPEDAAKKAADARQYSAAAQLSRDLRKLMRDPESLQFDILAVNDDASVVCAGYRSRNGFGGMNREFLVATQDKTSQSATDWNKYCTAPMRDMRWAAQ